MVNHLLPFSLSLSSPPRPPPPHLGLASWRGGRQRAATWQVSRRFFDSRKRALAALRNFGGRGGEGRGGGLCSPAGGGRARYWLQDCGFIYPRGNVRGFMGSLRSASRTYIGQRWRHLQWLRDLGCHIRRLIYYQ